MLSCSCKGSDRKRVGLRAAYWTLNQAPTMKKIAPSACNATNIGMMNGGSRCLINWHLQHRFLLGSSFFIRWAHWCLLPTAAASYIEHAAAPKKLIFDHISYESQLPDLFQMALLIRIFTTTYERFLYHLASNFDNRRTGCKIAISLSLSVYYLQSLLGKK